LDINCRFDIDATQVRRYEVALVNELLAPSNPTLATVCRGEKVLVCVDQGIWPIYGHHIEHYLHTNKIANALLKLDAPEHSKTMDTVEFICQFAKDSEIERRATFLAIGGGVTLDLVGLAGHLYRRGAPVVKVPTTLLGMIDAALGPKCGVNFGNSKNFLGAYSPPFAVLVDLAFLGSLSQRNIRAGLAEMIKLALTKEQPEFFQAIEKAFGDGPDHMITEALPGLVRTTIQITTQELGRDLYEQNLVGRADFGHTFSPAIEIASGLAISHGEAVAIDIAISTQLAYLENICDQAERDRIIGLLMSVGLPIYHPSLSLDILWRQVSEARKHRAGKLSLILPRGVGNYIMVDQVERSKLEACLE
jgi:2-epi-5-epi-valiolone synthase